MAGTALPVRTQHETQPKEARAERGPDQGEELFSREMGPGKGQRSTRGFRAGARGRAQVCGGFTLLVRARRVGSRETGEGGGVLGTPRCAQLLAVLAVGASPAPTLLGTALGVLPPPAPHPQAGLAMQVHFWEALFLRLVPASPPHVSIALSCEISLPPGVSLSSHGILGWQTYPSRFPIHHNSRAISRFMNARCPRVQVLNAISIWFDGYCKINWTVRTAPPIVQSRRSSAQKRGCLGLSSAEVSRAGAVSILSTVPPTVPG